VLTTVAHLSRDPQSIGGDRGITALAGLPRPVLRTPGRAERFVAASCPLRVPI